MRILLVVLALAACETTDPAPPAPLGGGGPGPIVTGGGGNDGSVMDAGPTDAPAPDDTGTSTLTCTEIPLGDFTNRAVVIQAGLDTGFVPTRAFATWNPARCSDPRQLLVVLGESESCRLGVGRRLVFVIDAEEIGDGLIPVGAPIQIAFASAMAAVYIDPALGSWSNCTGSDGDVTWEFLSSEPGVQSGAFNMSLVDCVGVPAAAPIAVSGAVRVTLDVPFEDVCTDA